MKRFVLVLFLASVIFSIAYSVGKQPSRLAELVTRPDGSQYIQCINPGYNCAV